MRAIISDIEGFPRPIVSYLPTGWVSGIVTKRAAWVTPARPGAVLPAHWSEQDLPDPTLQYIVRSHLHMAGWLRVMALGVTTKKAYITGDSPSGRRWTITGRQANTLPEKEIRLACEDEEVVLGTDLEELTEWLREEQKGGAR